MTEKQIALYSERTMYQSLLERIQEKYIQRDWEVEYGNNISEQEKVEKRINFFKKEVADRQVHFENMDSEQLVKKLYNDIIEFSVLTDYLNDEDVEGIDVNAWNNIWVKYGSGKHVQAPPFSSPEQAMVITQKLLKPSNKIIDSSVPTAEASIDNNKRITAAIDPIVDNNVGVAMYIRILRDKVFSTDEYVEKNFATPAVLHTVQTAYRRGASVLFLGRVDTGKTTLAKYVLNAIPNTQKIITIEAGAREMNLIKYDEDGNPINNVVHLLTRENSDREESNITQEKLVVTLLRLNPDYVSVAEMRDIEAYAAIEAANAGNILISTTHAGSIQYGHKRIANLARKKYPQDFHTSLVDAVSAFPIEVFIHKTEDGVRRIMNVSEAYVDGNDEVHYNCLWRYNVTKNFKNANGTMEVTGSYERVNEPSDYLIERMKMYGLTEDELKIFYGSSDAV